MGNLHVFYCTSFLALLISSSHLSKFLWVNFERLSLSAIIFYPMLFLYISDALVIVGITLRCHLNGSHWLMAHLRRSLPTWTRHSNHLRPPEVSRSVMWPKNVGRLFRNFGSNQHLRLIVATYHRVTNLFEPVPDGGHLSARAQLWRPANWASCSSQKV